MSAITNRERINEIIRKRLEEAINRLLEREHTVFFDYRWGRCVCSHFMRYNAMAEMRRHCGDCSVRYELEELFDTKRR